MACPAIDARIILPVASHAIRHVGKFERRSNFAHRLNLAMAPLAWNVFHDVRLMVEIDKIRKDVHPCPPNRLFFIPCLADLLNFWFRCCDKLMASHAGLHGGNHRGLPAARATVAILAVHLVIAGVYFVAERDRLAGLERPFLTAGNDHKEKRRGSKNKLYSGKTHYYFFLKLSNAAALHGPLPLYNFLMLSTSAGETAFPLFPNDERAYEIAAAISSFESLS